MAITYNLSIRDWYYDTTHQGTLDYPPLFAAFELLLAQIAHFLHLDTDGELLSLTKSNIRSERTIVYQKITVILTDFIYYFAVYKLCRSLGSVGSWSSSFSSPATLKPDSDKDKNDDKSISEKEDQQESVTKKKLLPERAILSTTIDQSLTEFLYRPDSTSSIALLLLLQPGLLLVDHIHFQYNGLLSGILLLSMANILQRRYVAGSFWFSILLNFKHIYLYCAPAFGMYLLVSHCLVKTKDRNIIISFILKAGRLGSVVILIFIVTYLPFANLETLTQITKRLFPFKRGLTHAYWAPNFWSLYNFADKILATVYKDSLVVKFDLDSISRLKKVSSTSGLVEEYEHQYLPCIKPMTTFALVGTLTLPIIIKYLLNAGNRRPELFIKGVAITTFTSFMFGWHVHEKAIISVILPLVPLSIIEPRLWPAFLRLTLAGTYSLYPLLFKPAECVLKICILVAYYSYAINISTKPKKIKESWLYRNLDKAYLTILILNELYMTTIFGRFNYSWNPAARLNKYEYLPLMSTSTLSALGIVISYLELYYSFLMARPIQDMELSGKPHSI